MTRTTDLRPEFIDYRDEGCSLHPACLTCPFARCRYETPGPISRVPLAVLDEHQAGMDRRELAARYGVTERQLYRVLARARQAQEAEAC